MMRLRIYRRCDRLYENALRIRASLHRLTPGTLNPGSRSTLRQQKEELPEWKRHYLENRHKSVDDKRSDQQQLLEEILGSLNSLFGPLLVAALKKVEGTGLNETEETSLLEHQDANELLTRLKGLREVFPSHYYTAIETVLGSKAFEKKPEQPAVETEEKPEAPAAPTEEQVAARVPRGFSKWDLKQIKLHESFPVDGKNYWVEFFSLKGDRAVGRILYNEAKDLLFFRAHDVSTGHIFPLTQDQGRKLTREGRAYYFKKAEPPPGES